MPCSTTQRGPPAHPILYLCLCVWVCVCVCEGVHMQVDLKDVLYACVHCGIKVTVCVYYHASTHFQLAALKRFQFGPKHKLMLHL